MLVRPLAPACGAEVFGLDLANPPSDAMRRVAEALARHAVLFFRDQRLSPEQQLEVTRRFGDILRVPYIQHLEAYPDMIAVLKEADERGISTFGGTWHSDFSFLDVPPSLTLLYALELPALKNLLRAVLHYHLGSSPLRTRQVMLDLQKLERTRP